MVFPVNYVDQAESKIGQCFRNNFSEPSIAADMCVERAELDTHSASRLVRINAFSGRRQHQFYIQALILD